MITAQDIQACSPTPLTPEQIKTVQDRLNNNEYLSQVINECITDEIENL